MIAEGPQNGLYLPKNLYGSGSPILRIDDFQNDFSRTSNELLRVRASEDEVQTYGLSAGDIVINRVNSPSHLGKCLLVTERNLPAVFESNMMRIRLHAGVDPRYIVWYLRSPQGRRNLTANAKWAVNQASINQSDIKCTRIPVPPLEQQDKIVAEVERCFSTSEELQHLVGVTLARASTLRRAILQQAFEGRLGPQDPNDEPASALLERIRQARASQPAEPRTRKARTKPVLAPLSPPVLIEESPPADEPEPQEADFLQLPRDEQVAIAWETLFGQGMLDKDGAIRTVADELRGLDLARFKRLRQDGPLYGAIAAAIERGVREGSFDRPRRGCVRAVLSDPKEYEIEDWQRCLFAVTGPEPAVIDATLRAAAGWAREALGLEYARLREDGVILAGLREALEEAVRTGEIVRRGGWVRQG